MAFFTACGLDVLVVTGTWLYVGDIVPLVKLCPKDYNFLTPYRPSGRGGVRTFKLPPIEL